MATAPEEMEDLSKVGGALLVNFGSIRDINGMLEGGEVFTKSLITAQLLMQ